MIALLINLVVMVWIVFASFYSLVILGLHYDDKGIALILFVFGYALVNFITVLRLRSGKGDVRPKQQEE
jgi:hypothetical protein